MDSSVYYTFIDLATKFYILKVADGQTFVQYRVHDTVEYAFVSDKPLDASKLDWIDICSNKGALERLVGLCFQEARETYIDDKSR